MASNLGIIILGIVAAAGVGVAVALSKKDEIIDKVQNNVSFQLDEIRSFPKLFGTSKFEVDYRINNDNIIGANDVTFEGALYYEGTKVIDIPKTSPIKIPAKGTTEKATIFIELGIFDFIGDVIDIIRNQEFSNRMEVRGTLRSTLPTVRVSKFITVKLIKS